MLVGNKRLNALDGKLPSRNGPQPECKPPSKYIFWLSKMGYSFAVLPLVVLIFLGYVVSFNSVRID